MDDETRRRRFIELVASLDFDRKYYTLVGRTHDRPPGDSVSFLEREIAVARLGRRDEYDHEEDFFKVFTDGLPDIVRLHLQMTPGSAEFIAVIGSLGDTFPALAREVAFLRDPNLQHDPLWPRPWFRDADELAGVLREGVALFDELAAATLRSGIPLTS